MTDITVAAAIVGLFFHLIVLLLPFEFELILYHFIATYLATFCALILILIQVGGRNFIGSLLQAALAMASFSMTVLVSMSLYRLFFHRIRKFPGPPLAKLSRFYATFQYAKNVEYYKELKNMHTTYGDYVRTGPREISILRGDAVSTIYGPKSECRKSSWYGQAGNDPTKVSINLTRDKPSYRLRRRAWDRGLAVKSLSVYQPRVRSIVKIFISEIRKRAGKPMDVTSWTMFFGFDLMGEIGFGKAFDNMATGVEHPAIQAIHDHIKTLAIMGTVPWLLNILGSIPGAAKSFYEFFGLCAEHMRSKEKTIDIKKQPEDIASWLLSAVKEKDVSASPTPESLADDSRLLIVAGSDTTSSTLACVLFYLAKDQSRQKKLQGLIDQVFPGGYNSWDYENVKSITYIDDIINEALRLKPPVLNIPTRETPPKGIHIKNVYIPGNINVMVPLFLIQRDPRWWKEADEFIPERWGERRAEMGTDGAPFFPFGLGLHNCIGSGLAFLSLRTSISSILQSFEITLAPGENGEVFDKQFLDTQMITLPPLHLIFKSRNSGDL